MLSYFYDPNMFIYRWNSNFVEKGCGRKETWWPGCHLVPPASCIILNLYYIEFEQVIIKLRFIIKDNDN